MPLPYTLFRPFDEPHTWLSPVLSLINWPLTRSSRASNVLALDDSIYEDSHTSAQQTSPCIRSDGSSLWLRVWNSIRAVVLYITKHVSHNLQNLGSFMTYLHPDTTENSCEWRTIEKVYRIDRVRVLKRSLRPDEYELLSDGDRFVPPLVLERLKNEAACMSFIRENTNIPVPKLLDQYYEDGSFHLWMEFVKGVEMSKLTEEQQAKVFPQIQGFINIMQGLRANYSGGPTGLLCPPSIVYLYYPSEWERRYSHEDYVFIHGDLSQDNIIVDPVTLQVVALIDWEYAGFFPPGHEIPYYKSPATSGDQSLELFEHDAFSEIIAFWEQSQKPSSSDSP